MAFVPPRRYLLTGATGTIGKALLDEFCQRHQRWPQFSVQALSRDPNGFLEAHPHYSRHPWLTFTAGNILDPYSIEVTPFDTLIHAAADARNRLSATEWFDQIVTGTRNMLSLAAKQSADRFLFLSSGAIYAHQGSGREPFHEDDLSAPNLLDCATVYGQAKRTAEHLCALFSKHSGVPVVIARVFALAGRYVPLSGAFAFGDFVQQCLNNPSIKVNGTGTAVRSYLDVRDAAVWLMHLADQGHPGFAYNVGSDRAITIADLAVAIRDQLAPHKKVEILGTEIQQLRSVYLPSIKRASGLGLRQTFTLSESVTDAVKFANAAS